jgi:hypothetical protein
MNFASGYGIIGNAGTVDFNITKEAVRALTTDRLRDEIERADSDGMAAAIVAIPMGDSVTRVWTSRQPCCSSPATTPATSPARTSG